MKGLGSSETTNFVLFFFRTKVARKEGPNYALINYIKPLKCFITGVIDLISPLA